MLLLHGPISNHTHSFSEQPVFAVEQRVLYFETNGFMEVSVPECTVSQHSSDVHRRTVKQYQENRCRQQGAVELVVLGYSC